MKPEDEEQPETASRIVTQLSERQRERMEVIQRLLGASDKETYRDLERSAAKRLNLSVSSIQRLVRAWKKEGVAGLSWRERSHRAAALA